MSIVHFIAKIIKFIRSSGMEYLLEVFFSQMGFGHYEFGKLIQNLIEFYVVLVLRKILIIR